MSSFAEYAPLIDTVLGIALALVIWGAYRELRARQDRNVTRKEAI